MHSFHAIRRFFRSQPARPRKASQSRRLRVESLESRTLLTAVVSGIMLPSVGATPPVTVASLPKAAQNIVAGAMNQAAKLTGSDSVPGDDFGDAVAISGDTIVVGAPLATVNGQVNMGAAYVFVESGGSWANMTEVAKLTASDGHARDGFGDAVAISGNTIVVGGAGPAYVFTEPAGGWTNMTQTAELSSAGLSTDTFANGQPDYDFDAVAIDGNTIVAGASTCNAACVFVEPAGGWANMTQTATLTPSDQPQYGLGFSVSISGGTIVAGAYGGQAAYVYTEPGSGWANMTQTAKLTAPDGVPGTSFGLSVSISGNTIAVAAYPMVNPGGPALFGPAPTITGISPSSGPTSGGTVVTITGDHFTGATEVDFGLTSVPFTLVSDTEITAVSPAGTGTMDIHVHTRNWIIGTGASFNDQFTYTSGGVPTAGPDAAFEGVTYVFVEPKSGWADMAPTAELSTTDGAITGDFNTDAVSIDGNTIAVAAGDATYVYDEPSGGWADMTETDKIPAPSPGLSGAAVGGDTLVVGANWYGSNNLLGAAYVYGLGSQTTPTHSNVLSATAGVIAVSTTQSPGTYGAGTSISINVTFNAGVVVTGTPQLALNAGGGAAHCSGGSGTSTLTFNYTVAAGQKTSDLDYASIAALTLNGGTIRNGEQQAAVLTLPATGKGGLDGLASHGVAIDAVPPVITSTTPASVIAGQKYSYQVKAAAAGATITYSLHNAPSGMSINATSGLISWSPSAAQTGSYAATVTATDQYGNVVQQTFAVNVLRAFTVTFPGVSSVSVGPLLPILTPSAVNVLFANGTMRWWL